MGGPDGREDRPPDRGRAPPRAAGRLAGRLRRRPHHRPGRAVPGPAGRRPHLLQPGPAVRSGAPGLLPVRAVGRRRRLHPLVLRPGAHGRGQRVDVPRLAPHGRGGDRRDGHARGDGRRPDARHRLRLRRQPGRRPTPRRSSWPGSTSRTCPAASGRTRRPSRRLGAAGATRFRRDGPRRRAAGLRHAHGRRRAGRRRQLLRDQAAVRAGADRRASAGSRATASASSPTTRP